MAGRVKPRPDAPPPPKPEKPKAKGLKGTRLKPVSKKRAAENRANDQIHENFMRNNPHCDCGCGNISSDRHHICSGAGRAASLFDTDTQLALYRCCHALDFSDLQARPIAMQVAMKWKAILRKVNRYRGRAATAITLREVVECLDLE